VLSQVRKYNQFFIDDSKFPPRPRPMPATWKPQDENGEPLSPEMAREEWIQACNILVPQGGKFTCEQGLAFNRWHMAGHIVEVCFFSLVLSSITPVRNSAQNR
jgi:hypothetical protein